jgi:hypothetical protein
VPCTAALLLRLGHSAQTCCFTVSVMQAKSMDVSVRSASIGVNSAL